MVTAASSLESAVRLQEIRLTLIYHETLLDVLAERVNTVPLPAVVSPAEYERELQAAARSETPLTPPWPDKGHKFWRFYLGGEEPTTIPPRTAFRLCVPLRKRGPAYKADAIGAGWARSEALLHPWGITWLLTLDWIGEAPDLEAAGDLVVRLRNGVMQSVQGGSADQVDAVAARSLDGLRTEVFGISQRGGRSPTPMSVLTIVRGKSSDIGKADPREQAVQQFLHASTRFREGWRDERVVDLDHATKLARRTQPADQVVYGHDRGLAIWAPRHFVATGETHSLACLHRNHAFVAAQVESFTGLLRATSAEVASGAQIAESHKSAVRRALGRLDALYAGGQNTYQSGGVKDQIEEGGVKVLMEELRPRVVV
jgi:hypothetical protein